ncbi:MAG: NADH:flavin oxidoreductase/NADH oxidase [Deltaproteobacteria bacterium]|nr:NADH:flavin oxidoreductase/NADH oxidase [Deltaproteobacteria bacterium]
MTPPPLFSPIALRALTLDSRIVVAPMCQYSAHEGVAGTWHRIHVPNLAMSGAGLVFLEATAVRADGRISVGCLGLYDDAQERALAEVLSLARAHGQAKLGIQLAHAGRKGSCDLGWKGGAQLPLDGGGWPTVAPSANTFNASDRMPSALDERGLTELKRAFAAAAERAVRLGFDVVELHCAHGYLLHEFLSPITNQRADDYGGTLANRMRFPLEVFEAMRTAMPADGPLGVRISATDWVEGGWDIEQSVALASELKARGCDFIDVSSGGLSPAQQLAPKPGFQVPFAARIKREARIPTVAVGLITDPLHANHIVAEGEADFVALARGMLWNPRWGWHAAEKLGMKVKAPPQVLRGSSTLMM